MHVVLVLIREMIKNIYDHGTGEGILILKKEGLDYEFDFIDNNKEIVNFDNLCTVKSNNGWTKKSKNNFGVGLSMIKDCLNLFEEFKIDDTKGGINYYGKFINKPLT